MSRFVGNVVVEQFGALWVVRKSLRYLSDIELHSVKVPAGFLTDFASIPQIFWNLVAPSDPEYSAAAIVHDKLYATHEVEKVTADSIFLEAMAVTGTPRWKRNLIWSAVHCFGQPSYETGPTRQKERAAQFQSRGGK